MKISFSPRISIGLLGCLAAAGWLGISSVACAAPINQGAPQGKLVAETILTYEDNGKSIETPVGASLSVRLEESPTTGYVWINKTVGDVLLLQNSDYSPASPGAVGGGGLRTLRFLVGKSGSATLLLKRMREWEGDSSVVEVFSVSIRATRP